MLTELEAYQSADLSCIRTLRLAITNPELDGWAAYEDACTTRRQALIALLDKQTNDIMMAQSLSEMRGG